MYKIRKSNDRGKGEHGWLHSKHTFSFADYRDPEHMSFKNLRVINEDRIDGGTGFGSHPHRDMEIISYVISGALEHKDSMGNSTIIKPDEVQRMSAGSGITHSEQNHMSDQQTHFFQIWIVPNEKSGNPSYAQKIFTDDFANKNKVLVISKDGREGSLSIKQDADLFISRIKSQQKVIHEIKSGRGVWLQIIDGKVCAELNANIIDLETGDGLAIENESLLQLLCVSANAEFLLFDLA